MNQMNGQNHTMNKRPHWYSWIQAQKIRKPCMALLLACCWLLAFASRSSAHAVLISSDPAQGAVLRVPPGQVRLWFSEAVDPQLSTAQVVTPTNQQAGPQQSSVPQGSSSEIVVTLQSSLTPGVYVVLFQTVSTDDGHVEAGSFSFTVTQSNGTLPSGTHPPVGTTTGTSSPASFLDLPTLLSLFMTTLTETLAIGFVGATIFQIFVLKPVMGEHPAQRSLHQQVSEHLLAHVLPLVVYMSLLAHVGVLLGDALTLTSGNSATALTPTLLLSLVLSGHFGLWWLVRVLLLALMLLLLLGQRLVRKRTGTFSHFLSRISLFCGLVLLIALAMSSHAAALGPDKVTLAVLVDWVHLFAAALWVGGMLTIVLIYLPVLSRHPLAARASSLVMVLPYYSPWALTGVFLMAITGPLSATFQLASWQQLLTTAYGNVLLVKVLLVTGMLLLSAYHVLVLRPRVRIASQKYAHATARLLVTQSLAEPDQGRFRLAAQVKQREVRLAPPTRRLMTLLRIEPALGVAVLLCVGLMNVLGGTLVPATAAARAPNTPAQSQPVTLSTFDKSFQVTFTMTPRQVGTNQVQVRIGDPQTGNAVSTVKVQLNTEFLDRDMGVAVIPLAWGGDGQYRGSVDLPVSGTWRIIVQIQTPDDPNHFREAYTDVDLAS